MSRDQQASASNYETATALKKANPVHKQTLVVNFTEKPRTTGASAGAGTLAAAEMGGAVGMPSHFTQPQTSGIPGQLPIQVIGSQYAKNTVGVVAVKNPYFQKQKVQSNSRAQNRARTASKPRGTLTGEMVRGGGDVEAQQVAGKRAEKGGNVIGGIRIKVVDKKKGTSGGTRGGTGAHQESRVGAEQALFGEGGQGQVVQRPVTGPSAVGGSSQSVGRGASGPYAQSQFALANTRTGYSQNKSSQRGGTLASSTLNHRFVGASGQATQQFVPPNAFNSQLQLPSQALPPAWQMGTWGAAGVSPAGRKHQQPGVSATKAGSKQGQAHAEAAESKRRRMAQSKSYKNIRMYNNLLEEGQNASLGKGEKLDGHVSKEERSAQAKDGLASSQPHWPRPGAAADLVNKFQARSRSSQGGRPAMTHKNLQNPLQDPMSGPLDGYQPFLERRDSRGYPQDHAQLPLQPEIALPHPPTGARKPNFYSGKDGKDFYSTTANMLSQHIPTIEKIYKAQADGHSGRNHVNFQSHLQPPQLAANAQGHPSQSLKHRHVIPKIKKSASSKNQANQFKQAQHHYMQNIVQKRHQGNQGLNYLTADPGANPAQHAGTFAHPAFDQGFNSATVAQMQHAPLLSNHMQMNKTMPTLHLLRAGNAKVSEVSSHAQQAFQSASPGGGRNHRPPVTASGPEGAHASPSAGPSSGMGTVPGKIHGQELGASHSQGTQRRTENEQMLNYIKVKNKLMVQNQLPQQQPARNNLAKLPKSQVGDSAQQQWQGQSAAGPSGKPQGNHSQPSNSTSQSLGGTGHKQHMAKGTAEDAGGHEQHPKGRPAQTKSQDSLAKVQRAQRNELRPKSVKNRPPALTSQTQQTQREEPRANDAQREKAEAEASRNDEAAPIASSQSNRPFQGQGAQMNNTPDLHAQEPQKPTIPAKVIRSQPALHISSSQPLDGPQHSQSQSTLPGPGSGPSTRMPKQPGQAQHPQTTSQTGGHQSGGQKVPRSTSLSSRPKDGRNHQTLPRKTGSTSGPSGNGQQQSHNLNSKDMVKKAATTVEADSQRKEVAQESAAAQSSKKGNADQQQMSSKAAGERTGEQKIIMKLENKPKRKSLDSGASRSKQQLNQDQSDATNTQMARQGKEERAEALTSSGTGQQKPDDAAAPSKSKAAAREGPKSSLLALIRHPLRDYYSKLNDDLRGIDAYQENLTDKLGGEPSQVHSGRQPLNPKEMERDSNVGGEQSQKRASQLQSKAASTEKSSKVSDYQYGFVSHGGWSADRQDALPNLTFSTSCQGVKEHPKSQSPSGGPQHSKCSFFVLFETIQPSEKKNMADNALQARQQSLLKRLSRTLQDNVLSNQNFLNNPTDALAGGLTIIRKEALQEQTAERTHKKAVSDSDQSKGPDGRQDLITVREQNLGSTSANSKEAGEAPTKQGLPSQLVVIVIIDDICLCANIGSCRAIMSSKGGGRLYCLNMEHTVPGNEIEEKRILAQMAKHKKQAKTPQEHAFCRDALTEYIATINLPQTRMIGPVPPREHAQDVKKQKYDKMLDQLQQELIISDPDITAIQLTDQEEFIIIGSSGLFKRLQGQDLQNIVWQRALILGLKQRQAGAKDAKIDPSELAESLIQMASIKKGQGNLAALVVLFPVFNGLVNKFLDILQQAHGPITGEDDVRIDFGALRVLLKNPELLRNRNSGSIPQFAHVEHLVEVDEIELEPIPLNEEQDRSFGTDKAYEDTYRMLNADDQSVQDNIDEIIYSHSSFAGLLGQQGPAQRRPGFATGRAVYGGRGVAPNMLSSIPEESSIKEMDINSSSIVTDQNQLGGLNSSEKMDRDLQSLVVPQTHGPDEEGEGSGATSGGGTGTKKNHRRFGKNATKFLGSGHGSDSQIKTLEQVPADLEDVRVQTPIAVGVVAHASPTGTQKSQLINIQFGNNTNSAGSDQAASKDGKLRLSNHHSKKNSRTNSQNHTIEENDYIKRDLLNTSSLTTPALHEATFPTHNVRSKTAWSPPRSNSSV